MYNLVFSFSVNSWYTSIHTLRLIMKIAFTSDTHFPVDVKKWFKEPLDVFVHAGDLMTTGYPEDFHKCIQWLAEVPATHRFYICGNHDFHMQLYPGPALQELRAIGVKVIGLPGNNNYNSVILPNGMSLLGLPYVTNLPHWAFNIEPEALEAHLTKMGKHDIIVAHSPIHDVLDAVPREGLGNFHTGIKAYRKYVQLHKPKYFINGHIHESYGHKMYNDCAVYNVAMCNRNYEHANPPIVLEL